MGFQTNFQQKNIYHTIEKQLVSILDKQNAHTIQNYDNFITPSSNLSIMHYNGLLDALNRTFLKKKIIVFFFSSLKIKNKVPLE